MHSLSPKAAAWVLGWFALAFLTSCQTAEEPSVLCKVVARNTQYHFMVVSAALPAPFKEGTKVRFIMDGETVAEGKVNSVDEKTDTTLLDLDPASVKTFPMIGKMIKIVAASP